MKQKIFGIISTIMAILLAVGVMTVFRACPMKEDGTWMHCHSAQMDMMYLGLAMAICSAVTIFIKQKTANIIMNVVNMVFSVLTMLVPTTFVHMCMMNTMRCHAVMKPFSIVMAVVILLCNLCAVAVNVLKSKTATSTPVNG